MLSSLRQMQSENAVDLLSTLQTVELNITELCNRRCSFCPRGTPELYKNKNKQMTIETIQSIAKSLQEISYTNRVSFVGFGEPFMHRQLAMFVSEISNYVSAKWIEVITNGDFITFDQVAELVNSGCTHLTVSMYDLDISNKITELLVDLPIVLTFKHLYKSFDTQVNRTEILSNSQPLNICQPCYLPFYKMLIDWNGDVLLCNNDWGRNATFGNVNDVSIRDAWLSSSLNTYRHSLINGNRSCLNPCSRCNINGKLFGASSVAVFNDYFNR